MKADITLVLPRVGACMILDLGMIQYTVIWINVFNNRCTTVENN